jgi:hypothetical protein
MALVPFVNLVPFFKRPADWTRETSGANLTNTVVVLGVALVAVGAGLGKAAKEDIAAMHRRAACDPAMQHVSLEMMLRSQGLETTLRDLAGGAQGQRFNDVTTLLRVEADGTTLRYVYEVTTDQPTLPPAMRDGVMTQNCTQEALRPIIEAGATIEHVYHRADGPDYGTVTVTRALCGY